MKIVKRTGSPGDDSMVTRADRLLIDHLAKALISAFVTSGRRRKIFPESIRSQLLELLPRLLGDPTLLREYTQAVREERRRQSVDEILLILPGEEIPIQQIAAEGFQNLDDAVLADLAFCPEYLETLQEELYDNPELDAVKGDWLFVAQEKAIRTGERVAWKPTLMTVVQPIKSYRKWWLLIGGICGFGILLGGIGLFMRALSEKPTTVTPSTNVVPDFHQAAVVEPGSRQSQPSFVSQHAGKFALKIEEFEMMNTSHPETPYRLKITTPEPVYLMNVFGWRKKFGWLCFSWHGSNGEHQIPAGTSEVVYPADKEKRKFQGFAGYLMVFTTAKVPMSFWDFVEALPDEQQSVAKIDGVRDLLLTELSKIGIPPEKVYIFVAVNSTIGKD